MKQPNIITISAILFILQGCDNPGGISNADYEEYKQLGAPKILYACNKILEPDFGKMLQCVKTSSSYEECKSSLSEKKTDVYRVAGVGINATYNKLLSDAKGECKGEFKLLESEQYATNK